MQLGLGGMGKEYTSVFHWMMRIWFGATPVSTVLTLPVAVVCASAMNGPIFGLLFASLIYLPAILVAMALDKTPGLVSLLG